MNGGTGTVGTILVPTDTPIGEAAQLTPENLWQVFEWAESKPYHSPDPDGPGTVITGLTIFTPAGRAKAEYGDWVVHTRGGAWRVVTSAEFEALDA